MEVLLFTIFVSILLAAGFVVFFIYIQKNPDADADRDSLLPLEEEHKSIEAESPAAGHSNKAESR